MPEVERRMGALPAVALVAGSMLGIGIFISPPEVARHVGTDSAFLILWLVGGLVALCGALSLAELGAMSPRSGGDYPYLRDAWGPGVAFAAGWMQILVIFPGSLASIGLAIAKYQWPGIIGDGALATVHLAGFEIAMVHVWGVVFIVVLTLLNHVGLRASGRVQLFITGIPLLVLLVVSVAVLSGAGAPAAAPRPEQAPSDVSWGHLARAYLPVYFAYSGWNAAIYIGGEIDQPGRNLPRALIGGTGAVIVFYLVLCFGFLEVFSLSDLATVGEAGSAAAKRLFGPSGVIAMTALIALAMLGSLNGSILTGSRIGQAMAEQGQCARYVAHVSPRFGTPTVALWIQAALGVILLIMVPDLEALIEYASSGMLITSTLTVLAVIVLRHRSPELPRPYRTLGYPLPPLIHALCSVVVLIVASGDGDQSAIVAIGWFLVAWAGFRFWNREPGRRQA